MAKRKPKVDQTPRPTDRTVALRHLATYLAGHSEYISERYWSGFFTGLMQDIVHEESPTTHIEEMAKAEGIMFRKKAWKKDPRENGVLNGRRFALTYLTNVDYEMIFGDWAQSDSLE